MAQSLYASDVRFREEEREGEAGWLFDYHWFMAEFPAMAGRKQGLQAWPDLETREPRNATPLCRPFCRQGNRPLVQGPGGQPPESSQSRLVQLWCNTTRGMTTSARAVFMPTWEETENAPRESQIGAKKPRATRPHRVMVARWCILGGRAL